MYASPSWWGFFSARDGSRMEQLINKLKRIPASYLSQLCRLPEEADQRLFRAVIFRRLRIMGPSIKYVTLFLANFDLPPPVTLCHTSRDPPPESASHISDPPTRILVGLVQKSRTKVPCTNSSSIVRGGFCPGGFVRLGFCPFPLCHNTSGTTES